MKKGLLFVFAFFTLASAYENQEKVYLHPDQIVIRENEIFIHLKGNVYSVNGIFRDENGLYISSKNIVNEHSFSWTCPLGHPSPDGSGMCNRSNCQFEKK